MKKSFPFPDPIAEQPDVLSEPALALRLKPVALHAAPFYHSTTGTQEQAKTHMYGTVH
jgi:hypothetical protein